jgi:hypothetical protein
MSKAIVQQFINANANAYAKASKVFAAIESQDFASTLAEAGIVGSDIKVFATIYVADKSGVNPHPSQRGGALVFKKDSAEYNRVKYLVDVATGVRDVRAKAKKATTHARITPEARKAAKAFLAMFDSVSDAVAVLRAVA